MLKRRIRRLPLIAGICLASYLAYFYLGSLLSYYDYLDFDAPVWRRCDNYQSPKNPRGLMTDSLRKRLLTTRPTRNEVLALLGPPDCMYGRKGEKENSLRYRLGAWGAFGLTVDYECLEIHFDEDRRVKTVLIRE